MKKRKPILSFIYMGLFTVAIMFFGISSLFYDIFTANFVYITFLIVGIGLVFAVIRLEFLVNSMTVPVQDVEFEPIISEEIELGKYILHNLKMGLPLDTITSGLQTLGHTATKIETVLDQLIKSGAIVIKKTIEVKGENDEDKDKGGKKRKSN